MSYTVVIKDNKDNRIIFASEHAKAFVLGAVASEGGGRNDAASIVGSRSAIIDTAVAVSLAKAAIEKVEEDTPELKIIGPAASEFVKDMHSKQSKKEDSEND